ncbi:hypothetical protein C0995_000368 [Termitomyces sp. Mi166|nr:hypothetical protein C0995_000368 [Termitomyces sp. Mi166\
MNISAAPEEHRRRTMGKAMHQQELSQEQAEAISLARDKMTAEQRQLVDQRNRNVNVQPGDQNADRAGPRDKGKGPDPCSWGEANLSGDELDPEVQCQILDACNTQWDQGEGPDNTEEAAITSGNVVIMTGKAAPPTRDELRERLRKKRELDREIRQLQKELKKSERNKKRARRAGSEPISNELHDMINQVTQRAQNQGQVDPKDHSSQKLRPVNQVTKDSALGRAFERMRRFQWRLT